MVQIDKKTVLVVDDSAMIRRIVVSVVEQAGYRALEAADGYEALAVVDADVPALLILDLIMPGMTGLATLEQLRARPECAALPVLMLTVEDSDEVVQQAMDRDICGYLTKPIDLDELKEAICAHAG